jgi:hypothetical protein
MIPIARRPSDVQRFERLDRKAALVATHGRSEFRAGVSQTR